MKLSGQRGWLRLRGKKWNGHFRKWIVDPSTSEQKQVTATVILGLESKMSRAEAREMLEYEIRKYTGEHSAEAVVIDGTASFGWFVRKRFFPLKDAMWRPETAKTKKSLIERDLIQNFQHVALQDFDRFRLQMHLNRLAESVSRDRVLQMRSYIRDIFAEATDQGFIEKDPSRKLRVPLQLRETDKTTLSWDQLRSVLEQLCFRDRILLELSMTNALRPSELFALKW